MDVVWAVGVMVGLAATIEALSLPDRAREVARRGRTCLEAVRDPAPEDAAKEERLQRHALRLFGLFGLLAGGSLLAIGLLLGAVRGLDLVGWASFPDVLERLDFLAALKGGGRRGLRPRPAGAAAVSPVPGGP